MIEKPLMFIGIVAMLFFVVATGMVVFAQVSRWYKLQAETQFIVQEMAEYGGYTTISQSDLQNFCAQNGYNFDQLKVTPQYAQPSTQLPVWYGQPVALSLTYESNPISIFSLTGTPVQFSESSSSFLPLMRLKTYAAAVSTFVGNQYTQALELQYINP